MTREELLYKICPTDTTYDCRNGNKYCNCDDCVNEMKIWLEEYDKQIKAEVIEEVNKKLDDLEINCESCYGSKIVEMYADTYEMFRKWLKEQENISL